MRVDDSTSPFMTIDTYMQDIDAAVSRSLDLSSLPDSDIMFNCSALPNCEVCLHNLCEYDSNIHNSDNLCGSQSRYYKLSFKIMLMHDAILFQL